MGKDKDRVIRAEDLPYRPCVGIMVLNKQGLVWAGRRIAEGNSEYDGSPQLWQMPQGGIDAGEKPRDAAYRELWEETGIASAELIAVTDDWWNYDFPARGARVDKLYPFRGQRQRWAAFRLAGSEDEITLAAAHTEEPPEFLEWRWRPLTELPAVAPPHRRQQYARVLEAFGHIGPA